MGVADRLQALADDLVADYIEHCLMHGHSRTDVGSVLGKTREAVRQRFDAPHKRYPRDVLTADLHEAMAQMKTVAVRHRNNDVGTEHLLWGLTAEDNTATRLLRAAGASPQDLHRAVEDRLEVGASPAAVRIAWTPYSRKAIAVAEERAARAEAAHIDCARRRRETTGGERGVTPAMVGRVATGPVRTGGRAGATV